MTRDTSIEAYRRIKDEGLLSKKRWQVYDVVFRHGPLTASETFEIIKRESVKGLRFDSNTHARFTELRDMGVLTELGTTLCSVTGRRVIRWEVTKRLPIKWEKPKCRTCPTCKGTGKITEQQAKLF